MFPEFDKQSDFQEENGSHEGSTADSGENEGDILEYTGVLHALAQNKLGLGVITRLYKSFCQTFALESSSEEVVEEKFVDQLPWIVVI